MGPDSVRRTRTGRVSCWRDGAVLLRYTATAFLDAEQPFRRIMGYRDLWRVAAYLDEEEESKQVTTQEDAT